MLLQAMADLEWAVGSWDVLLLQEVAMPNNCAWLEDAARLGIGEHTLLKNTVTAHDTAIVVHKRHKDKIKKVLCDSEHMWLLLSDGSWQAWFASAHLPDSWKGLEAFEQSATLLHQALRQRACESNIVLVGLDANARINGDWLEPELCGPKTEGAALSDKKTIERCEVWSSLCPESRVRISNSFGYPGCDGSTWTFESHK